ncbi:MAG: rod shape-determining protein MreC [Prevotellaceae bacterium]|jgi:rod shape-determining protein MreC|nr:rod shape-determining protein MreC [Prevotellaceae bacterium]
MDNLFRIIVKFHFTLMFIVLEAVSIYMLTKASYFRQTVIVAQLDAVEGGFMQVTSAWKDYFGLRAKNRNLLIENLSLLDENIYLKNRLEYSLNMHDSSNSIAGDFDCVPAIVVENTPNKNDNRLILNVGRLQGIEKDMGVISVNGVIGIVERVTDNFCTALTLLNSIRHISGKLVGTGIYGPVVWDRQDIRHVEVIDIPQHIAINTGDTVVTSGLSLTFPEGIMIGTVASFRSEKGVTHRVRVKLSNDYQAVRNVYVIRSKNRRELDSFKEDLNFK